jgi:tRNA threonylcarbamoyladenosine biosynthesis protein TsaE
MTRLEASVQKKWDVASEKDVALIIPELLELGKGVLIWMLSGQMGAGKTTFTRILCDFLGTEDHVSSPTYSIVNEYLLSSGDTLYHFDLYRLNSLREAQDIGIEEYLDSGAWCIIEWPGLIDSLVPDEYVEIELTQTATGRTISLKKYETQN